MVDLNLRTWGAALSKLIGIAAVRLRLARRQDR